MSASELQPLQWPVEWAYASGVPESKAHIKSQCSDFLVTEDLGYEPCGGENTFISTSPKPILIPISWLVILPKFQALQLGKLAIQD